jgi:prepilin-type N-terminal cleavage/methylation domain-containing protein
MRSERGYTLLEIVIVVALIATVSGIAIPVFLSSNAMNRLWTSSERVGALIRQTRLKAISQNTTYEIRFSCPTVGRLRALVITGDPAIDTSASRCSLEQDGDSEIVEMPTGVTYDPALATGLQVTGRGVFTALGDAIPLTISVTYGSASRFLTVSATGQISFSDTEPE